MYKVGVKTFSIPARSPDINPVENVFHYAKRKLYKESLNKNITFENLEKYFARVRKILPLVPAK